jgi:hypothetical protein
VKRKGLPLTKKKKKKEKRKKKKEKKGLPKAERENLNV